MCGGETEAETWQAKKTKRKATANQGVTLTEEERESRQKRERNGNRTEQNTQKRRGGKRETAETTKETT